LKYLAPVTMSVSTTKRYEQQDIFSSALHPYSQ
jgi:hypothetical protein